jgi:uncharacterized protein (DUF983 family)
MYSIMRSKCPHCQEGDFFKNKGFKGLGDVPDHCASCGEGLQLEPGFYYGAMYISYGMGVVLLVSVWVAFAVLAPDIDTYIVVLSIFGALLLFGWKIYKLSRIIWANMFFKYKGNQQPTD